jgi:hypothetical protein
LRQGQFSAAPRELFSCGIGTTQKLKITLDSGALHTGAALRGAMQATGMQKGAIAMPRTLNSLSQQAAALLDLPVSACTWPIGDDGWCGEPATHGAYCGQHHQVSRAKNQRDPSPMTIDRWFKHMNAQIESKRRLTAAD